MPSFAITTPQRNYEAIVERGILSRIGEFIPAGSGKVFVITTEDVWQPHSSRLARGLAERSHEIVLFPGSGHLLTEAAGEIRERLAEWIPQHLAEAS